MLLCFLYIFTNCMCDLTLVFSVVVLQLAKLFADLSTMADLTLPTTPQVSAPTPVSHKCITQKLTFTQLKMNYS